VWLSLGSLRGLAGPAATIPAALVGTFAVMSALGFSVNTLTLLALVVAIGLVVDDAIVVLENVTRKREQGQGRMAAAILGAREVFLPVVATTAVLAAVLLPIAALTGLTGRLFTQFAVTLTSAVALSSLLALSLGAMLASRTAEAKTGAEAGNPLTRVFTGALGRAEAGYARLVGALVRAPWLAAALAVGLGAGSWGLAQSLPGALAPTEDRAAFIIPVNAPEGATLSETEAAMREIAEILEPYAGEDGPIEDVISIAGAGTQGPPRVSEGLIIAKLRPWGEREISQQALVGEVIGPISALPGAQAAPINPASLIPQSFGKPIQVYVAASDHDRAKGWAEEIFGPAVEQGGLRAPRIEFDRSNPQIALSLDRRLASDLGLSAAAVGEALRVFFGGDDITEFHRDGETYEVMVRGRPEDRDREAAIGALQVRGAQGRLVPLASAVETQARGSAPSYRRIDRRPAVVISAVPAQGADFAALLGRFERLAGERLPPEAETGFLGLSREFAESRAGFLGVMGLALAVVYLLPLAVMLAAPLAVTGGLAGLWAAGLGLNVFSQIGLLLAVGLMAKNAILVVDFANRRRAEGLELAEAARAGARARFRPVVMTSVATLFGAVPLALATGAGAESRTVIGVAVLAGVTGATLITLFLVPALYRLFGALSRPPGAASAEADRQLAEAEG
jgi:multidrug efflux pump